MSNVMSAVCVLLGVGLIGLCALLFPEHAAQSLSAAGLGFMIIAAAYVLKGE